MKKRAWLLAVAVSAALTVSCGGANENAAPVAPSGMTADRIDADPLALLPTPAVAVGNFDARAFFASSSLGPQIARLTEQLVPIGEEAGFVPSRDVDRVVVGSYAVQGFDVVAVVVGRFDAAKIAHVAEEKTPTKGGAVLVTSDYAGRKVYTVSNVGFSVLTARTALVGTETAIHRALDRVHDGTAKNDVTPWMLDTINTPNAAAAVAADFASQPIAAVSIGALPLPWLKGLKAVRVLTDFKAPGMHVAGTLSYAEPAQATKGGDGLRAISRIVSLAAIAGAVPKIRDLDIETKDADVQCSFALDEEGMRKVAAVLPQVVY
jgi:hypothetical protein